MAFSDSDVSVAWSVVKGKCECSITSHKHLQYNCNKNLDWGKRGRGSDGYWEAHHLDGNPNNDSVGNCGIFCWSCHELTF